MSRAVYMDYAATTPVDPQVAREMCACLGAEGVFANPASAHAAGREAAGLIAQARRQVADLIGASAPEIVWTSGATEAINLALKGALEAAPAARRHVITSRTEHSAGIDVCRHLEAAGARVTWLNPAPDGIVDPAQVAEAIADDTVLVSVMHVNNETGVIHDVAAIGRECRRRGILFHVDAAQSAGKLPLADTAQTIDLLSLSAHKFYGPKGAGALFVRDAIRGRIAAQIHGGRQEQGLRSGTLATHQIVGMGVAAGIAAAGLSEEMQRILALRQRLLDGLGGLDGVILNGHPENRVAGIINLSFAGVDGESLLLGLRALSVSSGSACTSAHREPSYVLRALGRSDALAAASVRFSLGRYTEVEEVDLAVDLVRHQVSRLRKLAPDCSTVATDALQ